MVYIIYEGYEMQVNDFLFFMVFSDVDFVISDVDFVISDMDFVIFIKLNIYK